jgi:hypothetical protein
MKSKEKFPIKKESAVDIIQNYIDEKIKKSEGDINPNPLRMVDRKLLIPEAQELFRMFADGNLETANAKLAEVLEKIEKIKNEKEKDSNLKFVRSFDHDIEKGIETEATRAFNEKHNT